MSLEPYWVLEHLKRQMMVYIVGGGRREHFPKIHYKKSFSRTEDHSVI